MLMSLVMLAGPFLHMQFLYVQHHWRFAPYGVYGDKAMVVSAHGVASKIGRDVLQAGGNAFDAAVAVQFALAVVYQQAGNIGGGGFMVYRLADGSNGALDFREKAPRAYQPPDPDSWLPALEHQRRYPGFHRCGGFYALPVRVGVWAAMSAASRRSHRETACRH